MYEYNIFLSGHITLKIISLITIVDLELTLMEQPTIMPGAIIPIKNLRRILYKQVLR